MFGDMTQLTKLMDLLLGDAPLDQIAEQLAAQADPAEFTQGLQQMKQQEQQSVLQPASQPPVDQNFFAGQPVSPERSAQLRDPFFNMTPGDANLVGAGPNMEGFPQDLGQALAPPPAVVPQQQLAPAQIPPQQPQGPGVASPGLSMEQMAAQMSDPGYSQVNPLVPEAPVQEGIDKDKLQTALQAYALMQAGQNRQQQAPRAGMPSLGSAKLAQSLTPSLYAANPAGGNRLPGLAALLGGRR